VGDRITRDKRHKVLQLANLFVAMEKGFWDWGDGLAHNDPNGNPLVNKKLLLERVWPNCSEAALSKYYSIMKEPVDPDDASNVCFWTEVHLERARYESGLREQYAKMRPTIGALADGFRDELAMRFRVMPGSFTNDQLLRYMPALVRLKAEIEGGGIGEQFDALAEVLRLKEQGMLPDNVLAQILAKHGDKLPDNVKGLLASGN
jgi:hypothetical protein